MSGSSVKTASETDALLVPYLVHSDQTGFGEIERDQLDALSDSIINSLPGIFYLFDEHGRFLRWNKRFEIISGFSGREIRNKRPTDFFAGKEKSFIMDWVDQAYREGGSDAEAHLVTRSGKKIPHYFTGRLISYLAKPCVIGMGIDISERKKAEAKIKGSNERYRLAMKATNDAVWDWNIQSGGLFWGEGLFAQFGHRPAAAMASDKFWKIRVHPQDRERVMKSLELFIENNNSAVWSEEYRFKKANGQYAIVADRGFLVFGKNGKALRVVGSMQNVTEKKALEKKLLSQELNKQKLIAQAIIHAQENERAEIGKELHDNVNQMLSTCKLYLDLARTNTKKRKELIDLSVNMLNNSISEIKNISRALVPQSIIDLGLIASVNDLIGAARATHAMNIEFFHRGEIDQLLDDRRKLMLFRIVQEQMAHVLKQTKVSRLIIDLTLQEELNTLQLDIFDDGLGYDLTQKDRKGLAVNNIISRVELFNGSVDVVTAPGEGCKISVYLPISSF